MVKLIETPEQFSAMLEGSNTKLAVVDFFAEWCVLYVWLSHVRGTKRTHNSTFLLYITDYGI